MEHRPDRFTAVLDANILATSLVRNTILQLAASDFFRPRWSSKILDETIRAIRRRGSNEEYIERLTSELARAFGDEALIEHWEVYVEGLIGMPDEDDRHVLAAAIKSDAAVIVTENLKHFPDEVLSGFGLEAIGADDFIADTIDLNQQVAAARIKRMRAGFRNPKMSSRELVRRYEEIGLIQTSLLLATMVDDI